jgi:hypothetical protein
MKSAQQKAIEHYRNRQKSKGLVRMEVSIPDQDREAVKALAANLRAGGQLAENTRQLLVNLLSPYINMNFKEFLEAAPIDDLDLKRPLEKTRDVDL